MQTPLNASAISAGNLLSSTMFEIPPYQREYSWQDEQVRAFWEDIEIALGTGTYFLGLIILTENERKHVVDGQQRLITLTLLFAVLYHEAQRRDRHALADKIYSGFLTSIDYETDESMRRVILTDANDDTTLAHIIKHGSAPEGDLSDTGVSGTIVASYKLLKKCVTTFLKPDPFKKMGELTKYLTDELYFAVFIHPDPGQAYSVFEVINTRGRGLTTADLLKSYILSQTAPQDRDDVYQRWMNMADRFPPEGNNNTFVQFIRHVVTVYSGHVLPKDLFFFLAGRTRVSPGRTPPTPMELISRLEQHLPRYLQMIDQSLEGPADPEQLAVYEALNNLNVLTMRPIMLALAHLGEQNEALEFVLRLVVRRVIVGQLGTGNIERRFSEAAHEIYTSGNWDCLKKDLADLNPSKSEFFERLHKRTFNKRTLAFIRSSILEKSLTPNISGYLHFICPSSEDWPGFEDESSFWLGTLGNTILSIEKTRDRDAGTWDGFKNSMLEKGMENEIIDEHFDALDSKMAELDDWDASDVSAVGEVLAARGAEVWYG